MNDTAFFTLLAVAVLLHAGLIYLNRHLASGADHFGSARVAAVIARMADVAALIGWGGLALFIAVARGQPASYSVPTLLGAPLVFIPMALLGHTMSVALMSIQGQTANGLIRAVLLVARKASIGLFAVSAFLLKAGGNLLVMVMRAIPKGLDGQSSKEDDGYYVGSYYNLTTGKYDNGMDPYGRYVYTPWKDDQ